MTEKTNKPTKKLSRSAIIVIVGLILILVPVCIYGGILVMDAIEGDKPIYGDRFNNDLNPAITNEMVDTINKEVKALEDVEKLEVQLISGQLRINVDTKDDLDSKAIKRLTTNIYKLVGEKIDIKTYFTSTADKRMYDLSILVFNSLEVEDDKYICYELNKNAKMEKENIQLISDPIDKDITQEIYENQKAEEEPKEE